ncbi:MAG: VOC family protein [Gemmatimonadetes bacterium]|nr:VOC family protein [Gemmatimonadota bacterium]MDA1102296.1 VOC family protein [Gemmatimonadota bacterium]
MIDTSARTSVRSLLVLGSTLVLSACAQADTSQPAQRPDAAPTLTHVGLNSTDPEAAVEWYLKLWPSAERTTVAGLPAVAAEMYLVFQRVETQADGAFDPALGRSDRQSAFWHIGAFANTTNMDGELDAIGVEHLPLYTGPDDENGVWRSGLTPYAGTLTADRIPNAEPVEPRPGGFSYVLAPDGVLFEITGGPTTVASLSHIHFFHEHPQCAANWYVEHLGMELPPVRHEDGTTSPRPAYEPCEDPVAEAGWPSLERAGTIRDPRGTVVHGNGSMSWYPRQCVSGRCGADQPLVTSRGQVLDHVAFEVDDLDGWRLWLGSKGVTVLEDIHDFGDRRAFMIEGPDRLAIELVDAAPSR